jgi:tetratricopeptide (TPR) repeat protein
MQISTSSRRYAIHCLISGLTLASTLAVQLAPIGQAMAQMSPADDLPRVEDQFESCEISHTAIFAPVLDRQLLRLDAQLAQGDAAVFETLNFIFEALKMGDEALQIQYLNRAFLGDPATTNTVWPEKLVDFASTEHRETAIYGVDRALELVTGLSESLHVKALMLVTVAHYYSILDAPEKARETLALAQQVLPGLPTPEVQVDYLISIGQVYQGLGDTAAAQTVLQMAQAKAQQVESSGPIVQRVELAIARIHIAANQPQQALDYAQTRDRVTQALILHEVAKTYAAEPSQTSQAIALLQQAIQLLQGDTDYEGYWWQTIEILAQLDPDAALALIPARTDAFQQLSTLTQAVLGYAKAGETNRATQMLNQIKTQLLEIDGIWRSGYIDALAVQLMETGDYALVLQTMATLSPTLDTTSPVSPTSIWVAHILPTLAQNNDLALWQQALELMPNDGGNTKDNQLALLAVAYVNANQLDRALALAEIEAFSPEATFFRNIHVRAAVATTLMDSSETAQMGQTLMREIQTQVMNQSNADVRAYALSQMVIAYTTAELPLPTELFPALSQAIQAMSADEREGVTMTIMIALSDNQQFDLARQVAILLNPQTAMFYELLLNHIIDAASLAEDYAVAGSTIDSLVFITNKVNNLLILVEYGLFKQEPADLRPYLAQARELARLIPGPESEATPLEFDPSIIIENPSDRGSSLERIALYYRFLGMTDDAIATANLIQGPTLRQKVLSQINCYQ